MAIDNIVQGLPIIERFIAVRDVGPNGTAESCTDKCFECGVNTGGRLCLLLWTILVPDWRDSRYCIDVEAA